ncbi:MAG TPA: DinB family protein [Gemmatimonadales bacterium]
MRVEDLEGLYDYHYWAGKQLLGVVTLLTPEEFTRSVAGSYGSVRNTLVHVLSAEWGWLERCGGAKRGERLNPREYPTAASLVEAWTRVEDHVRGFLSGLQDEDLARQVEFTLAGGPTRALPLGNLMQHAAMHAVHHRGQVSLLLRALGHVPGNFDLLIYLEARRGAPA